ncbi:hypothetical protein GCM10010193_45310 [Kitasatospora atroaurantiaca]|uniref:MoxR-vWA-beta-propeller ternary system domain-containing protein n=1 Tax=Kitasatospora atroaurantiaca TaxID=285545 RepID=A0A561EZQ2_9ACTN|nr:bpX6 domain-containing protein [Kitasatospora atroaurantiaca]TWE21087.1 hypothetical protein FB465_6254 [Kitasatospora atroaurantiaca]
MSGTAAGAFRISVLASGFVLDVPVIGRAEAADRVMAAWQDGAELRQLPQGSWLLRLATAVQLRADRAPGLPLVDRDGALVAVGADGDGAADEVVLLHGGVIRRHRITELPAVDPADWLEVSGLTVHQLTPLELPVEPETVLDEVPVRPQPDLRVAARLRPRSRRARLMTARVPFQPLWSALGRVYRSLELVLCGVLVLGFAGAVAEKLSDEVAAPPAADLVDALLRGLLLLTVVALVLLAGSRVARGRAAKASVASVPGRRAARAAATARRRRLTTHLRGLLAQLAMRSPAAPVVRARHERYLRELTSAFEQRRWEDALRDAIALASEAGDSGSRWLDLRLPQRRTGALRARPYTVSSGGASLLSGLTIHQHLSRMYREAAQVLERDGRIEEAAFVLADLMHAGEEAVALLERHGRFEQAAELAEGRALAPDLVVRLWWRAGERVRAIRTAQTRGAFASTVERLSPVDREAALELRRAWVRSCQQAGDRMGAVEAAWPEESLRPLIAADLRDGVAIGGSTQARALAHVLALQPGGATRELALATLESREPQHRGRREQLAAALARIPGADPAADRELATAAVRAVVRDRGFGRSVDDGTQRRLFTDLLERADPLAAADLRAPSPDRTGPARAIDLTAAHEPGRLPVLDAVALDSGSVLVACGEAGVRLLAPDGRTRARWDTPAHRLAVADHGSVVLLVARYGQVSEISRLDLATRAVRRWTALSVRDIVPSFDGRLLITLDDDGIAVIDTLAARPVVVWRELDREARVLGSIARTATSCSAVVASGALVERWRWDLPGWQLRSRMSLSDDELPHALLASGPMLSVRPEPVTGGSLVQWHGEGPATHRPIEDGAAFGLSTHGDLHAVVLPQADGAVRVEAGVGSDPVPTVCAVFPGADPAGIGSRLHGGSVAVWHRDGRVVAAAADGGRVLANLRVTLA